MHARGNYLSLLLLCELSLVLVASLIPYEIARRLMVALALLSPLLLLRRAPGGTPRPILLPPSRRSLSLLLLLPAFVLTILGVSYAWGWLAALIGLDLKGATPLSSLPLALLFDALLTAVCEEIFCRGAIYTCLRPLGRRTAVFISALIFALMHANLAQIPYAFVAGLLLAGLYELSGCLLLPMLFHFATNALSLLLMNGLAFDATVAVLTALSVVSGGILILLRRCCLPRIPTDVPLPAREAYRALASPALLFWLLCILILTIP